MASPTKAAAHSAVFAAIKRGDLVRPDACQRCGCTTRQIVGHHASYDRPLDVEWICAPCHMLLHAQLRREVAA